MGAEFISTTVKCQRRSLLRIWAELRSEAQDRSGHQDGYSGDWNCIHDFTIVDKVFPMYSDAVVWAEANVPKWEAQAIPFKSEGKIKWLIAGVAPC